MLRRSIMCIVIATFPVHAENVETLVERSQAAARAVLDRAVEAIGGEEALRNIESVRLQLEGDTWPRLQMPTPQPPFEGGSMRESLLIDFKGNRLRLEQNAHGAGFENHNTIVITPGGGTMYDHRAGTATRIPASQSNQQQFIAACRTCCCVRRSIEPARCDRWDGRLLTAGPMTSSPSSCRTRNRSPSTSIRAATSSPNTNCSSSIH
jgi:hypothetical protein